VSDRPTGSGGDREARPYGLTFILLVALLAFGLRAGSLTAQSLWRDEVDALCYAFQFPHMVIQALAAEQMEELITPNACPPPPLAEGGGTGESLLQRLLQTLRPMIRQNGPLYFFLLRGWVALAGHSEVAMRFLSLWLGVLCVPLSYVLGSRLLGRTAGKMAALLMATSPYMVWYGQEVKMYTLVPALALLSIYATHRAAAGGGNRWWVVQVVTTSLAFYTHIWSALLVPVQVLLLASWWPRWRSRWLGASIALILLTLPYLPLALWQLQSAFVTRETGFPHHTLQAMALVLLNGWSMGIAVWGWPLGAIACGGAALLGLVIGLIRRERRWLTLGLVGWLAAPLAIIWLISLRQPLFTDRYAIWTAPAFYLLAGAGLAFLWRQGRWPALPLLAAILLIFGINLWVQATTAIKSDLRAAAACVEREYQPEDLLVFQIPHVRYTFDYYFESQRYAWADGLYTNHRWDDGTYMTTEGAVAIQMDQITQGYHRVWLVASEVEMWDERNLVHRWLETSGNLEEQAHFTRVDVYAYDLGMQP
jgi:mannosyltransferase